MSVNSSIFLGGISHKKTFFEKIMNRNDIVSSANARTICPFENTDLREHDLGRVVVWSCGRVVVNLFHLNGVYLYD
jgi:hypothetical protein